MEWRFRSKDVVVEVVQHTTPTPGYVRGYRLTIRDEVSGWTKGGIDIGLEKDGYDDTVEEFLKNGMLVIGSEDFPDTLDAIYTREARDCAVKLIGYAVGQGKVEESSITLKAGVPHVIRLAGDGAAMNGLP